ncbi:hypothetical protein JWG40_12260 [Leptospira sp. 201903074]|uniref:hypothetical protein n=1 Tax=Leptospira abararensis TaxID=2810036 RepID=UPI001965D9BF|nr:hypothetical protein [Leptospira abararensis]MBM9547797.1 hypothetical protein [Leptospira abararensis]
MTEEQNNHSTENGTEGTENIKPSLFELENKLNEQIKKTATLETLIQKLTEEIPNLNTTLEAEIAKTNESLNKSFEEFQKQLKNVKDLSASSEEIYQTSRNFHEEITKNYNSIFGYVSLERKYLTEEEEKNITTNDEKEFFNEKELKTAKFKDGSIKKFFMIEKTNAGVLDQLKNREIEFQNFIKFAGEKLDGINVQNQNQFNTLLEKNNLKYEDLLKKISALYQDAIGVGLAGAYNKAKASHRFSLNLWTAILVVSVLGMLAVPISMEIWVFTEKLVKIESVVGIIKRVFSYLPFISPMVFLAYIATKNMNGYRRMFEEYLYKESTSLTYEALKREITTFEDSKLSAEFATQLLRQNLQAAEDNPSKYLDKIDGDLPTDILKSIMHGRKINISIGGLFGTKVKVESIDKEFLPNTPNPVSKDTKKADNP